MTGIIENEQKKKVIRQNYNNIDKIWGSVAIWTPLLIYVTVRV